MLDHNLALCKTNKLRALSNKFDLLLLLEKDKSNNSYCCCDETNVQKNFFAAGIAGFSAANGC